MIDLVMVPSAIIIIAPERSEDWPHVRDSFLLTVRDSFLIVPTSDLPARRLTRFALSACWSGSVESPSETRLVLGAAMGGGVSGLFFRSPHCPCHENHGARR